MDLSSASQVSGALTLRVGPRYPSTAEALEATDVSDPSLTYGVVVDCGSSGSRVFVYYWPPHNGNPHTLLDIRQMRDRDRVPVVKKIKPGESREGGGETGGGLPTGGTGQVRSAKGV